MGRGAWTVRTFLPLHLSCSSLSTPAGEAGGSNGRCDGVFHWKPALGLWNNWKPGCPVSSGLILGGITGRAATDEEGRKIRVTERPNVQLQASSNLSIHCKLPPHLPRYNIEKTFMIRPRRQERTERVTTSVGTTTTDGLDG